MPAGAKLTGDLTKRMRRGERMAASAVRQTVRDMQKTAQARSRVDTGAMKDGWVTAMIDDFTGQLGNPVKHVIYNEFGTRHMSAQPMLKPAVESAREPFIRKIRKAYE